jgi:predicted phage replisome organizer
LAEVKWIKITTDMFDNRKIKHLRKMPEGNNIVLIWVMLLTMAGRCNASGMIFLTENIPYTTKMLADELDFDENTIILALRVLSEFGMIVFDTDKFAIQNWEEHQNVEGMDKIREQTRKRVAKYRENQKKLLLGSNPKCVYCGEYGDTVDHVIPKSCGGTDDKSNTVCSCLSCNMQKNDYELSRFLNNRLLLKEKVDIQSIITNPVLQKYVSYDSQKGKFVTHCNATNRYQVTQGNAIDIDIDKEIDIDNNIITEKSNNELLQTKNEHINYQKIVDEYNSICVSLSKVKKITNARKKSINARLKIYTFDEIIEVFKKAESSDFLKGANNINFQAGFDWLMADKNMAKVLEGKYDNKKTFNKPTTTIEKPKTTNKFNSFSQRNYTQEELDELERKLLSK